MTPTSKALTKRPASLELRRVQFEDVAEILRIIGRAIASGCREHYDAEQRATVFATYASSLFVDALGPFEAIAAELDGRIVGFAQLDPGSGRLRALFVDDDTQRRGVGRALVAEVEARARAHGRIRLHGTMSLNAISFYEHVGFHAYGQPERLGSGGFGVPVPVVRMEKRLRP